ncbi:MAG: MFS transporter [Rhodospirillaceae bacterium]|jgi:MFS family permease
MQTKQQEFPWRLQLPIYATGFFNGNIYFMTGILMPLWAIFLVGPEEPFLIGLIVASRQIGPVLFSIHGGTLMDRFGARRIMLVLGMLGALTMAAFPHFPMISAVLFLQILNGFAESTCWIGSQTLVGNLLKGNPVYTGRLSFFLRCGGFLGPTLSGYFWQSFGAEAGFYFMASWIFLGWFSSYLVPKGSRSYHADTPTVAKVKLGDVIPRSRDYIETFRLALIPAVGLMAACTLVRQTGSVMQVSFYPVWLNQIGVTAFDIGFMVGFSHIISAGSSLSVASYTRWISEHWLLIVTIGLSVLFITVTPMLSVQSVSISIPNQISGFPLPIIDKIYLWLLGIICLRGFVQGINMPLMMSLSMRAVGKDQQGKVAALRVTLNRLGTVIFPVVMGAIAEVFGLEVSFYAVGGLGILALIWIAWWAIKKKNFT